MRVLSIICIIMVMALNMVPCADAHERSEGETTSLSSTSSSSDHHSIPVDDSCTPFCHCTCCASTIVVKATMVLPAPFVVKRSNTPDHFEESSIDVSLSVWQPPKLV